MPPSPREAPELPEPSLDELAFSEKTAARIQAEVMRVGPITFTRFMELALYQPGFGYYTASADKLGARGDFITAPEAYPLFGRCLARAIAPALAHIGGGEILEVGAGNGKLAAVLLNELAALGAPLRSYQILDVSADLRRRQRETIDTIAPAARAHVRWLDQLPPTGFRGVILANELLDAIPVERFCVGTDGVRQLRVTCEQERFAWTVGAVDARLEERIAPLRLPPGYISEVGFAAEAWVRSVAEILESGILLLIDYGFPRHEFYHPDRSGGTLMCHYRHRAHGDPLRLVGLQDITAHVDFTAIAQAGNAAGLDLLGYTSQAAFLIGAGVSELVAQADPQDARTYLALTEQVKKLTLPHEMGELYKAIAFGRGFAAPLSAFSVQDRRARL